MVGVDDFAWKRGHRYGTIICDLERRCIIDILPDREAATTTAWLAGRPSITIIARDRGAGYKQAATEGRPDAVQVADRWHLMENASAAFLTAVQRSMITIRKGVGAGIVDPAALSAAERHQHAGWLRRESENADILALSAQGVAIKEIMRRTDKSRWLVRQVVRGARNDIFRSRMSSLDPFLVQLETAWSGGSHNGAALWRAMKTKGFNGSLRVVTEWVTRKRKDEGTATRGKRPNKIPSARRIARMMTTERDTLSKAVAPRTIAMIGAAVPDLTTARDLLDRFHRMIIIGDPHEGSNRDRVRFSRHFIDPGGNGHRSQVNPAGFYQSETNLHRIPAAFLQFDWQLLFVCYRAVALRSSQEGETLNNVSIARFKGRCL